MPPLNRTTDKSPPFLHELGFEERDGTDFGAAMFVRRIWEMIPVELHFIVLVFPKDPARRARKDQRRFVLLHVSTDDETGDRTYRRFWDVEDEAECERLLRDLKPTIWGPDSLDRPFVDVPRILRERARAARGASRPPKA